MVVSERRYLNCLEIVLSVFMPALETLVAPRDLRYGPYTKSCSVPVHGIASSRLLFPCHLEPLIGFHQDFLENLEQRLDPSSRWHGIVGDLFHRMCGSEVSSCFPSLHAEIVLACVRV